MSDTIDALTSICIQFGPDGPTVQTTWGDFQKDNQDAFSDEEFNAIAYTLHRGAAFVGMSMIYINREAEA